MGHTMWHWPVPGFLNNAIAIALTQMLLTIVIMIINRKFFISGVKSAIHGAPNMDTLVALGAGVAFGYSVYVIGDGPFATQSVPLPRGVSLWHREHPFGMLKTFCHNLVCL